MSDPGAEHTRWDAATDSIAAETDRFQGWAGRNTRNLPKGACGWTFCPAPIRMLWLSPDVSERAVTRSWVGCSVSVMRARADRIGLPASRRGRTYKHVSERRLRAAWADVSVSLCEAAASVGLHPRVFQSRVRCLGLPKRKSGKQPRPLPAEFAELWRAGVKAEDIAGEFGMSPRSVQSRAMLNGLVRRQKGVKGIPIASYRAGRTEDLARYGLPESFDDMWRTGVCAADLGRLIHRHESSITKAAKKRGLKPRPKNQPRMTVAQFLFARTAQEVKCSMRAADMVDVIYRLRPRSQAVTP